MKQWKRLTYYLMLNILVSAITTFTVLLAWDRTHPVSGGLIQFPYKSPFEAPAAAPVKTAENLPPQATPTPVFIAYQVKDGDTFDSIAQVYHVPVEVLMAENGFKTKTLGAGEVLRIPVAPASVSSATVNIDSVIWAGDLNMEHVLLKHSGQGELALSGWSLEDEQGNVYTFPELTLFGGAVNVYTRAGSNTVVDLYWGLQKSIWQSGKKITLRNSQGTVVDTYLVP